VILGAATFRRPGAASARSWVADRQEDWFDLYVLLIFPCRRCAMTRAVTDKTRRWPLPGVDEQASWWAAAKEV
jgi:hypothetical protein